MVGQTDATVLDLATSGCDVQHTPTSLVLLNGMDFERWAEIGAGLKKIHGGILWWLGDWVNYGERRYGEKYSQALEATEYEYQTLVNAGNVAAKIESNRRRLNLSWSHHAEVAALPPDEQEELLDKAEADELSKRDLRKAVLDHKRKNLPAPKFPPNTYRVVYADPPWKYSDERTATTAGGGAVAAYPLMPIEDICALADPKGRLVCDVAQGDSVCFLWVTSPLLPWGLQVLAAWGFEYKASFVWDKVRGYNGHYNDVRHEMLLIGTRGSCLPDTSELADSVVAVEKAAHSAKPDDFYELIERMYKGPRLELFARRKRAGWDSWGNQA